LINITNTEGFAPRNPRLVLLVDWGPNIVGGANTGTYGAVKNQNLMDIALGESDLGPRASLVHRYSDFEDRNGGGIEEQYKIFHCVKSFSNYSEQRTENRFGASKQITVTFMDPFGFFFEVYNKFSFYHKDIFCKLIYTRDPGIYDNTPAPYSVTQAIPGQHNNDQYSYRVPLYALKRSSHFLLQGEELLFNGHFMNNMVYDYDQKTLTVDVVSYQHDEVVGFIPQPRHLQFYKQSVSTGYYDDNTAVQYNSYPYAAQYALMAGNGNTQQMWPELFGKVADYPAAPILNPNQFVVDRSQLVDATATKANSRINVFRLKRTPLTDAILQSDVRVHMVNQYLDHSRSGIASALNSNNTWVTAPYTTVLRYATPQRMYFEGSGTGGNFRVAVQSVWFGAVKDAFDGSEYLTANFYTDDYNSVLFENILCTRFNDKGYFQIHYPEKYAQYQSEAAMLLLDPALFAPRFDPLTKDMDLNYFPYLEGLHIVVQKTLASAANTNCFEARVVRQEGNLLWLDESNPFTAANILKATMSLENLHHVTEGAVFYSPFEELHRCFVIDSKDDATILTNLKYKDKNGLLRDLPSEWLSGSFPSWDGSPNPIPADTWCHRTSKTQTAIENDVLGMPTWYTNKLWNGVVPPCTFIRINATGMMRLREAEGIPYVSAYNLYDTDWSAINYLTLKYGQTHYTGLNVDTDTTSEFVVKHHDGLVKLPFTTVRQNQSISGGGRGKTYPTGYAAIYRLKNSSTVKELGFNGYYTLPPKNPQSRYIAREIYWPLRADQQKYYTTGNRDIVTATSDHPVNFVLLKQEPLTDLITDIAYQVGKNLREVNLGDDFGVELVDLMDVRFWEESTFVNGNFMTFMYNMLCQDVPIEIETSPLNKVITDMKFTVRPNNWLRGQETPIIVNKYRNRNYFGERRDAEEEMDWFVYDGMNCHTYMNYWINKRSQPYLLVTFAAFLGERDPWGRPVERVQLYDLVNLVPTPEQNTYLDSTLAEAEDAHYTPFKNKPYRQFTGARIGEYRKTSGGQWGYFGRIVDIQRIPDRGIILFKMEVNTPAPHYQDVYSMNPSQIRFYQLNAQLPAPSHN
jgi:hypothetical protein